VRSFFTILELCSPVSILCGVALCWGLGGCATTNLIDYPALSNPQIHDALRESAKNRFPDSFEAVHRGTLTVRKRQFNLDGYLRVDDTKGHRLVAAAGFGNVLFELAWNNEWTGEIVRESGLLKRSVIEEGPGEDMNLILRKSPSSSAVLSAPDEDTYALTDLSNTDTVERYLFDRTSHNLLTYQRFDGGKQTYSIQFRDVSESLVEGFSIPKTILVRNGELGYSVDIRLVSLKVQ